MIMGSITSTFCCSLLLLTILSHLSDAVLTRFGCWFDDDKYALRRYSPFYPSTSEVLPPFIRYDSIDELNGDLALISLYIGLSLGSTTYNDLDDLLHFHVHYTFSRDEKDIKYIFNKYQPIFHKGTPFYYLTDTFNRLNGTNFGRNDFESYAYLVTVDLTTKNQDDINRMVRRNGLPGFFNHDHIAIAMRFRIRNSSQGIILIDPLYLKKYIAVIPFGESLPDGLIMSESSIFNYELKGDYIVAKNFFNGTEMIFYAGVAFCSVLETTVKRRLFKLAGNIAQKNNEGKELVKMKFQYVPDYIQQEVNFVSTNNGSINIPLNADSIEKWKLTQVREEVEIYDSFVEELKLEHGDINDRMTLLRYMVLDDRFLRGIFQLRDELESIRLNIKNTGVLPEFPKGKNRYS